MTSHRLLGAVLAVSTFMTGGASAQDREQIIAAFSGQWYSFEPDYADAGTCAMELTDRVSNTPEIYQANVENCSAPLNTISGWSIVGGQIRLSGGAEATPVAALGGNQFRISGDVADSDRSLVLERAAGDENSRQIREAISTYRCIYRGFTDECASPEELRAPRDAQSGTLLIRTLVNLNIRNQPRADAPVLGVAPKDTAIAVDECLVTSDGMWCEAVIGDMRGWITRTTIRQDKWPILTFVRADSEQG
ncbi:SH3 domain-containing protein [Pseudoponticoccus marisrubri]|uniref:SH3b domain-containing protein n=1 Tax=Pseudoponticoccus marisrubri TaxID=1685382 RepID=A0A0W7WLI5_9RHOB|nr:SH3 domain-containing protein [Pseudoponticoccus marisrubri]KUF11472.1 hypothetical protein AVJ23_06820 [Pseudoponticoccus marisrubri]